MIAALSVGLESPPPVEVPLPLVLELPSELLADTLMDLMLVLIDIRHSVKGGNSIENNRYSLES